MTRSEALDIEKTKLANPEIPEILTKFLKEIKMSREEFESSVRDYKKLENFRNKKIDFAVRIYRKMAGI
jgi:hypothetical protein